MAADPIIYCLDHVTDYRQFERFCHDLMAMEGFQSIEPLGGIKDKGRDAIYVNLKDGITTIFAYTVRKDWQKKLEEDRNSIFASGHNCHQVVFVCTSAFTSTERDAAIDVTRAVHKWNLQLYGLERIRIICNLHSKIIDRHPQIFTPSLFPSTQTHGLKVEEPITTIDENSIKAQLGKRHRHLRENILALSLHVMSEIYLLPDATTLENYESGRAELPKHLINLCNKTFFLNPIYLTEGSEAIFTTLELQDGGLEKLLDLGFDVHILCQPTDNEVHTAHCRLCYFILVKEENGYWRMVRSGSEGSFFATGGGKQRILTFLRKIKIKGLDLSNLMPVKVTQEKWKKLENYTFYQRSGIFGHIDTECEDVLDTWIAEI